MGLLVLPWTHQFKIRMVSYRRIMLLDLVILTCSSTIVSIETDGTIWIQIDACSCSTQLS